MKKMTKEEKAKWVKKLKVYAEAYEKAQEQYHGEIARIEKRMNRNLKSKEYEYEFHISDCGWLIGRINRKAGRKQALVHDMEFYDK